MLDGGPLEAGEHQATFSWLTFTVSMTPEAATTRKGQRALVTVETVKRERRKVPKNKINV